MPDSNQSDSNQPDDAQEKESCIPYFDALWFCYSPVYQFQHYYKFGRADDCSGHWSNFYSCLKSRTKFKVQAPEAPKHPLWTIRSKEEAEQYWKTQYGAANFEGGKGRAEKE
ncbi:hypothetical protein WJX74_005985 [Apatococcus lobatus]|uniref:Uncharacterized protein n=1 Tax=Apatococcus lobatus TaxID=904363 RepID=A0AAW1RF97_9CHLO